IIHYIFPFTSLSYSLIYTLSLHDALPIYHLIDIQSGSVIEFRNEEIEALQKRESGRNVEELSRICRIQASQSAGRSEKAPRRFRSEEHTSELQSRSDLVCRLLLEKKKKYI